MRVRASTGGRAAPALLAPAVVLALTLSGCSAPTGSSPTGSAEPSAPTTLTSTARTTPATTTPAGPASADPPTPVGQPAAAAPTQIALQFGDVEITGTVEDTAAGRSLLAQLPAELDFSDYGGQEKIATLPSPLDLSGAPDRAAAPAGTLGYYAPDQGLVLYYDSVGAHPGIVPLGVVDDVESLRGASDGSVEVRVRD
ncbi:hypothetical protein SAMN06295885_2275 [Rathayibacter oskolensis]|uniref:Cyclophilin-like domain-containing protein n=1 Tax=Rathayibacter oskolensis TaxID=1891671 RepID=A0A1X7P036_9MICO|nr:cyclophilin-like fold protein [Rathayibacter oskolensis]SMH43985.1 hypothetical protein SAMN06295885_2275 [Rathayibacter oskolensis]